MLLPVQALLFKRYAVVIEAIYQMSAHAPVRRVVVNGVSAVAVTGVTSDASDDVIAR